MSCSLLPSPLVVLPDGITNGVVFVERDWFQESMIHPVYNDEAYLSCRRSRPVLMTMPQVAKRVFK
jgi:hypothetical protein